MRGVLIAMVVGIGAYLVGDAHSLPYSFEGALVTAGLAQTGWYVAQHNFKIVRNDRTGIR